MERRDTEEEEYKGSTTSYIGSPTNYTTPTKGFMWRDLWGWPIGYLMLLVYRIRNRGNK